MPLVIPTAVQPALTREPRNLLIYGRTKTGKTTLGSMLPDALHLDLEQGTHYITSRRVNIESYKDLLAAQTQLREAWREAPFKFLVVDTIDQIDDWSDELALANYKKLPVGVKFNGSSVRELDHGGGWHYLREAFKQMFEPLLANSLWHTVFIGHVKDKYQTDMAKVDNQVNEGDIDLTGKVKSIVCARMDAIGYVYRPGGGQLYLTFQSKDQLNCGNRCPRLVGKTFSFKPQPSDWLDVYPDRLALPEAAATGSAT